MKLRSILVFAVGSVSMIAAAHADVTAVKKGTTLFVVGENVNDVIHVEGGDAFGEVDVFSGVVPTLVGSFTGIRSIDIKTGDGNDAINISGLEIGGSLKAKTGSGTDFLRIDDLYKDFATVRTTFIGGGVDVAMGDQAGDSFEILVQSMDKSVHIGGNVNVRGADNITIDGVGASSDADETDVDIGSNLVIRSKLAATVNIDDTNVGGATSIRLGNAADFVRLGDSLLVRKLEVKLGGGDDTLRFETPTGCASDLSVDGGSGTDALELSANVGVAGKTSIKKIEQTS